MKDLYSDALILSEGRYETRERMQFEDREPIVVVVENHKSSLVRITDRVVRRVFLATTKGDKI